MGAEGGKASKRNGLRERICEGAEVVEELWRDLSEAEWAGMQSAWAASTQWAEAELRRLYSCIRHGRDGEETSEAEEEKSSRPHRRPEWHQSLAESYIWLGLCGVGQSLGLSLGVWLLGRLLAAHASFCLLLGLFVGPWLGLEALKVVGEREKAPLVGVWALLSGAVIGVGLVDCAEIWRAPPLVPAALAMALLVCAAKMGLGKRGRGQLRSWLVGCAALVMGAWPLVGVALSGWGWSLGYAVQTLAACGVFWAELGLRLARPPPVSAAASRVLLTLAALNAVHAALALLFGCCFGAKPHNHHPPHPLP